MAVYHSYSEMCPHLWGVGLFNLWNHLCILQLECWLFWTPASGTSVLVGSSAVPSKTHSVLSLSQRTYLGTWMGFWVPLHRFTCSIDENAFVSKTCSCDRMTLRWSSDSILSKVGLSVTSQSQRRILNPEKTLAGGRVASGMTFNGVSKAKFQLANALSTA